MASDNEVVPFIRVESSKYVVEEDTLHWLSTRKEPFVVMMCAGKFRTGKSFLLNRFVDCEQGKGFGVGDTVQACTRGLWLCRKFVKVEGCEREVLVVDTEGIDALDVESAHDMRIFAMAVLLGSVFCFNSTSHIDETAVQTLSLMTRVASSMTSVSHKPSLYWILRDFTLKMVDERGFPITHQQYMETALTSPSSSKCSTREAIKSIFGTRHLVTLPRPHKTEATRLERIDRKGGSGGVNAKFESFLSTFREHVCNSGPFMSAGQVPMTGAVYADYVRTIVSLVNQSDSIPPLDDAWTMLTRVQHSDAISKARSSLIEIATEECPTSCEGIVMEWITQRVNDTFARVQFMEPLPDTQQITTDLAHEVKELMRGMNRIQDMNKIVQAKVDGIVDSLKADESIASWDMVSFLAAELGFDQEKEVFASKALDAIVKQLWPKVAQRLDLDEATTSRLKHTNAQFEKEADGLRDRVSSLQEELDSIVQRGREDASTCTSDLAQEHVTQTREHEDASELTRARDAAHAEAEQLRKELSGAQHQLTVLQTSVASLTFKCESFEKGIVELRKEAEMEIRHSKDESESCKKEMLHAISQREVLSTEVEKLHRLVKDAQEKSVEVHRACLDDTRKRDADARIHNEGVRKAHSEMQARAELSEREVKTLKRRVEELLVVDGEAKRLRTIVRDHEVSKAKAEVESEHLKTTLQSIRTERDSLRDTNMQLSNQNAVLNASQMLESCRRSIREM
jgi:predicted  nucleic acid-binding Zn-ribbon protein